MIKPVPNDPALTLLMRPHYTHLPLADKVSSFLTTEVNFKSSPVIRRS